MRRQIILRLALSSRDVWELISHSFRQQTEAGKSHGVARGASQNWSVLFESSLRCVFFFNPILLFVTSIDSILLPLPPPLLPFFLAVSSESDSSLQSGYCCCWCSSFGSSTIGSRRAFRASKKSLATTVIIVILIMAFFSGCDLDGPEPGHRSSASSAGFSCTATPPPP